MMENSNSKNLIIGILLGSCLMLVLGAAKWGEINGFGPYGGRGPYSGCTNAAGNAFFVIDTRTGHSWRMERSATTDFGTPFDRKSKRIECVNTGSRASRFLYLSEPVIPRTVPAMENVSTEVAENVQDGRFREHASSR